MKNMVRRSSDLLLFLFIFIVLIMGFKDKVKIYQLDNNKYNTNNLLTTTLSNYKYNKEKVIDTLKELPSVYIFNTHYEEEYSDTNVIEMSKILTEKLKQSGINSIFEDTDYKEYIKVNNLIGVNNYIMIRNIIESRINDKMSLVIDLHRDSITKKDSIVDINGIKYAKVLFVVDNYYSDYLKKYDLANKLNSYLNENYKGISRGVYVKNGKGFNQDLTENMILLELGGYQNGKEELTNTVDVIVEMIKEYIYGK